MGISRALERTGARPDTPPPTDAPLSGRWLMLGRVVWLAITLLAASLFVVGLPVEFARLQHLCVSGDCEHPHLTPDSLRELQGWGLSTSFFATYFITIVVIFALVWFAAGTIIFLRRSDDRMALFVAFFLVTFGLAFANNPLNLVVAYPFLWLPSAFVGFLGMASVGVLLYLFPDGRFVPRWTKWLAAAWVVLQAPIYFFPASPFNMEHWLDTIQLTLNLAIIIGALLAAQIYRYRRVSSQLQRQQTKWLIFSFALAMAILLGLDFLNLLLTSSDIVGELIGNTSIYISLSMIPISICVAILRYRLWDIDILINRSLVYGTLTASVIGLYVLAVAYLGALFQSSSLLLSLIATGLVAVLFQPLRDRLQRGVNRLMYGERDDPYAVIARLGERLEAALAPDAVLPTIVQTVRDALKLPYAAIALKQGEATVIAAESGDAGLEKGVGEKIAAQPASPIFQLPLTYQGEVLGQLLLAPRPGESGFSAADRRLLDGLARQAGVAAHAVRLTADLQRSRERLVSAREEERRRLRRDLHDGLGPALAAQTLKVGAARALYPRDAAAADRLLSELERDIGSALADIRRLVYNLRPPTLDELGLCAAIRECAAQFSIHGETSANGGGRLAVAVDAPQQLPHLPAAVEVAAYRIVQEALANVVRHAHAQTCRVRLALADGLELEVTDDGTGVPAEHHVGLGLTSMRERAEELGGTCVVEPAIAGGTRVAAWLPVPSVARRA
jgi:signal transduction histidine kinase